MNTSTKRVATADTAVACACEATFTKQQPDPEPGAANAHDVDPRDVKTLVSERISMAQKR
jgi:hypothetical protein